MTKLTEMINFKAAVAGAAVLTIGSALVPNAAQAFPFSSVWIPNSTLEVVFDLTPGSGSPTTGTFNDAINFRVQTASDIIGTPSIVIPGTTRNNLNLGVTVSNDAGLDFYDYSFEFDRINVPAKVIEDLEEDLGLFLEPSIYQGLEKVSFFVPSKFDATPPESIASASLSGDFSFEGSLNSLDGFNDLFADLANAGIKEIGFDARFFYRDDQGEITTATDNVSFETSSKSVPEPNNLISLFALGVIGGVSCLKRKLSIN
ncbi:MAG: hypothetical protein QNJ70_08030 [Xenococcaceae cyanobacterium MO_207.B15]|nr:hypothetical protein [Xenococcaceae cyanobacterium MO_207.B15]